MGNTVSPRKEEDNPWQDIITAPRDGTEIELTWFENGEPQEIYRMRYNRFAENKLFQDKKGIWAIHDKNTNQLLMTWSEQDTFGSPTHWRRIRDN